MVWKYHTTALLRLSSAGMGLSSHSQHTPPRSPHTPRTSPRLHIRTLAFTTCFTLYLLFQFNCNSMYRKRVQHAKRSTCGTGDIAGSCSGVLCISGNDGLFPTGRDSRLYRTHQVAPQSLPMCNTVDLQRSLSNRIKDLSQTPVCILPAWLLLMKTSPTVRLGTTLRSRSDRQGQEWCARS